MNEPTKEQVEKFWEWCGFTKGNGSGYYYPNKQVVDGAIWDSKLPKLDLNNIFKYAMPRFWVVDIKLIDAIFWSVFVSYPAPPKGEVKSGKALVEKDLALALFWAIWEVIK